MRNCFRRHWGKVLAGVMLFLPLFTLKRFCLTAAQQDDDQNPTSTLKVSTNVVSVYAVVMDKKGHLISNLNKDDFELTEDGKPQVIKYFSRSTDTPLTLGIMVDTSPSQRDVLRTEQEEADQFLHEVMRPKDMAFVLHFDVDVELLQDFTEAVPRLTRAVDETVINGGGQGPLPGTFPTGDSGGATHLFDAIYLAANDLMSQEVGRKVLIMLTDGGEQGSKVSEQGALEAAQKSDCMIYSVDIVDRAFYRGGGFGFNGDSILKKLSEETGGRVIRVDRMRDTHEAFQEIANELRTQYSLGYTSTDPRHDGGYRKIRVRVKTGNYKVLAKTGYYAPRS
jgi:VWFA-related protein